MQEKCPECGEPISFVGQKWECSKDPYHKIPFSGNRGYTGTTSSSIPPTPSAAQGGNIRVVPLRYPVMRSPGESSGIIAPKLNCPFCNFEFRLNEAAVVSTVNPGKVLRPGKSGPFEIVFGHKGPLDGAALTAEVACYQCPRCRLVLPYRYESSTNIYIGVIGDTYSGKTHYLAALLSLMKEGGMAHNAVFSSVRFVPQTEYTTNALEEYRQAFEDQREFAITRPFVPGKKDEIPLWKPLIFRMLIRHSTSVQESRSVNLVFYDLSGEDIANEMRLAQYGWPVLRAHAFIYLADPLSMKGVVDRLPTDKKPREAMIARLPSNEVLDRAIGVIRRYRRLGSDDPLPMPVAITISKSDILDQLIPPAERQNALFLNPVQYDGFVHIDDFMRNHEAISKWLVSVKEMQLRQSALYVPNSSFFAVSATGGSPNSVGKFASMQSRRCLDPLLWILWRFATGVC